MLKEKIEVIFFGHFSSTHWFEGVLAKKMLKIPYMILVHGTEFNAYFHRFTLADHWASGIALKNTSAVIVNSRATKNLVESHGYPSNQIHIVHPGTDPINFKSYNKESNIAEKLQLKGKKFY